MFDHNHFLTTPGLDVQIFQGGTYTANTTNVTDFQIWRKPSLARMTYMIVVSGGGAGGWSCNTASEGGGGAGGGQGSLTVCFIPSIYLPETIYIATGVGGQVNAAFAAISNGVTGTVGSPGANGTVTRVTIDPNISTFGVDQGDFGTPNFGRGGLGGTTTAGGAGVANPASGSGSWWSKGAGRIYGQLSVGGAGGAPGANGSGPGGLQANIWPGGGGGGSSNGTAIGIGSGYSSPTVNGANPTFWQNFPGGPAAVGSTPATAGQQGFALINYLQAFGGAGGGGDSGVAGGVAGNGGNGGQFGAGGGGAGGSTNLNPLAIPGAGADGAVIMICW
jgi:hypothetical protein